MPADHRLRLDDPQLTCPPVWPEAAKPNPQDAIPIAQTRLWPAALEHVELVAKNEVLENQLLPGAKRTYEDAKHQHRQTRHRRGRISVHHNQREGPNRLGTAGRSDRLFAVLRVPCEGLDQQRMEDPPG